MLVSFCVFSSRVLRLYMLFETEKKLIQGGALVLIALQTALVVSSYIIASNEGYLEMPKIYLSSAFRKDPARAVAGFLLPLSAYILGSIMAHRLYRISFFLRNPGDQRIYYACIVGTILAVVGMVGVAAVSLDVSKSIHWVAAAVLFFSSVGVMIGFSLLDERLRVSIPGWLRVVRISLTILSTLSLGGMGVSSFVSFFAGSIFELILAFLLIAYLVSLTHASSFPIVCLDKTPRSPRPIGRAENDGL